MPSKQISPLKFGLVLGDVHLPFHHKPSYELVLRVIRETKPAYVISIGDLVDNMALMAHAKTAAQHKLTWDIESARANKCIDRLVAACKEAYSKLVWVGGNHDEPRLTNYLSRNATALGDKTITFEKHFRIKERGIHFVKYGSAFRLGKVNFIHDLDAAGANAHRQAERDFCDNVVIGHTHRSALEFVGNARGRPHVAMMCGWLGDAKQADYMKAQKKKRYWTLALNSFYMEPNGVMHMGIHPIIDGKVVIGGRLFK